MLRRSLLRRYGDAFYAGSMSGAPGMMGQAPQYAAPQGGGGGQPRQALDPRQFIERVPRNSVVNVVPQGWQYVVERLGRYHRTLNPGLHFVVPVVDKIRYAYITKEQAITIPNQAAITRDNVIVEIDGVLFLRIVDAEKASYNIENPIYNLTNLAQTTMRSEIGKMRLDTLFEERANLNQAIVSAIQANACDWGLEIKRYEVRDISVSEIVRASMDLQAEAERRKRKLVLESEGEREAQINRAKGEAEAICARAAAGAESIGAIAAALREHGASGERAAALRVAEQYVAAFSKLAKHGTNVVLGANAADPAAMATQALSIYRTIGAAAAGGNASATPSPPLVAPAAGGYAPLTPPPPPQQ